MKNKYIPLLLAVFLVFPACVSQKKYKDLNSKYSGLQSDYNSLDSKYNDLKSKSEQNAEMSESQLKQLNEDLKKKVADLEASNKKVNDLEQVIQKQKAAQQQLLSKIKDALVGFKAEDLTVEMHSDGKVYVSLSEQLLFKSGSYVVDPKGKDALQKVATVLSKQPDIEIEVEGHTDNKPIKTGCIKDNWDLSVLRATSIVRILTVDYAVDPKQVSATGRGEFFPVGANDSEEGRAKNRRTEIILSPKISELYKIIEGS